LAVRASHPGRSLGFGRRVDLHPGLIGIDVCMTPYERGRVYFPFYPIMMLGLESGTVIGLRMLKLTCGGSDALNEIHLMMEEKVNAAIELGSNLRAGASADTVISRYRQHVAANAARLSQFT
jgi:hypothetical protein